MFGHVPPTFAADVAAAAGRPDALAAVRAVYADVGAAVDARRPACAASGKCCDFDRYGHDLFVTTLELAAFLHDLPPAVAIDDANAGSCPFQVGRLCGVHAVRPFGCRMFYCDPTAADWQREQYERFHAEIAALHDRFAVPYAYVEWRRVVASVRDLIPAPTPATSVARPTNGLVPLGVKIRLRTAR